MASLGHLLGLLVRGDRVGGTNVAGVPGIVGQFFLNC